jgi:transcriptional regulator with XRE-family HTH domain
MAIAQRVRDMRYAKGWGPDELAARAEISRTALYQIETGKTCQPRAGTLRRIAAALEVPMENLIFGSDDEADPAASRSQRPGLRRTQDQYDAAPSEGGPLSLPNRSGVSAVSFATGEESRFAVDTERSITNAVRDATFVKEGELMSKLHDLVHSPFGHGVARILEDLHGVLLRLRS